MASMLLVLPAQSPAATIHVPADQPTIQAAVNAAGPGDTIRVAPGDYVAPVRVHSGQTGLTIEAADPADPPVVHGVPHVKHDGFRVDRVDGITIRNFVIPDAYDGVRLNHVNGALVVGVRVERNALGVRVNRGSDNRVIGCTLVDANVEQGILFDNSPNGVAWGNVVVASDGDGIRVQRSPCTDLRDNVVLDARGDGIEVHSSPGTRILGSVVEGSRNHGIRVSSSALLEFAGNTATGNGNRGIWLYRSPPFATIADVTSRGNRASGNAKADVSVTPRRSPVEVVPPCAPVTSTTTAIPTTSSTATTSTTPVPTSTTVAPTSTTQATSTTTTSSTNATPSTRPTTSTTTLPQPPLVPVAFRLYVRTSRTIGADTSVDVPKRSIEAPLAVMIRADHAAAFRVGDHLTAAEIQSLGGDTLARLTAAADAHLRAHPADYPDLKNLMELRWAKRDS